MKTQESTLTPGWNGWAMNFENGVSLSVRYGDINYCANRTMISENRPHKELPETPNCEIAVIYKNQFVGLREDDDDVVGWFPMKHIPQLMMMLSSWVVSKNHSIPTEILEFIEKVGG